MKNKLNTSLSLRKLVLSAMVAAPLATLPTPLWALPASDATNLTSSAGTATVVTQLGTTGLSITTPDRSVLRWGSNFNIGAGESIAYVLPSATSAVLNTVTTGDTTVAGSLTSNGSVFILNPNGITVSNTAQIATAGLGLSTLPESDFGFQATGTLSLTGTPSPAGNVVVNTAVANSTATPAIAAGIVVGKTGSVILAGRNVTVTGPIDAKSLSITSKADTAAALGTVTLGGANALDLGKDAVTDSFGVVTPGYGTLSVVTNGGTLTTGGAVTVRGGSATFNTTGTTNGTITQTTGTLTVGDSVNNSTLSINAGTAAVTLADVRNGLAEGVIKVGIVAGDTSIITNAANDKSKGTIQFADSTIAGTLTVKATKGNITSAGVVDVAAGKNISLQATDKSSNKAGSITFKGKGDLTFSSLSAGGKDNSINLTSTEGSVSLPAISSAGSLSITAAKDITQVAATAISTYFADSFTSPVDIDSATGGVKGLKDFGGNATFAPGTAVPTVTFAAPTSAGGVTATGHFVFNADNSLKFVLDNAGSGYTTGPAVTVSSLTAGVNGNNGTATFDAGGSVTLTSVNATTGVAINKLGKVQIKNSPNGATVLNSTNLFLGSSSATGAVDLTAPSVVIGGGSGDKVNLDTTLKITAVGITVAPATTNTNGTVTDLTDNARVLGTVTINATGSVVLDGSAGNGIGLNSTWGQLNVSGTNVTVYENTTLNLGNISANTLRAVSTNGNIINTGQLKIANTTEVGAGTAANPGDISLNYTAAAGLGNQMVGTISVLDDFALVTGGTANGTSVGTYLAKNVTIVNEPTTIIGNIVSATNGGIAGDLSVTSTRTSADTVVSIPLTNAGVYTVVPTVALSAPQTANGVQATAKATLDTTTGALTVSIVNPGSGYTSAPTATISVVGGTTTVATVGTIGLGGASVILGGADASGQVNVAGKAILTAVEALTANNTSNAINTWNATAGGNVSLKSAGPVTVNAALTQTAAGKTALWTSGDALTVGSYTSNYSGQTTFQSGNKKAIADSVPGILIYGDVAFKSSGPITVNKSGHNFGGLTITPGDKKSATVVEAGTMRIVDANLNEGSLTVTSTNGSIVQDTSTANKGIRFSDQTGSNKGTFTANNGNVTLGDANVVNNFPNASINVTAAGDVLVRVAKSNLTLGNITTGGTLTADVSQSVGVSGTITVNTNGSNYGSMPTVLASAPNITGGSAPTFTVTKDTTTGTTVASIAIKNPGYGYTTAPTLTLVSNGAGYTVAPVVALTTAPAGGVNAAAHATIAGGVITGYVIDNNGSGYTSAPTISLTNTGTGATTNAALPVVTTDLTVGSPTYGQVTAITLPTAATITPTLALNGAGNQIVQATGTKINAYGTTSFLGAHNTINVSNTGNRFGGLVVNAGLGDASISEATTMNLKSVVAANLTALSENGSIIDSVDATIAPNSIKVSNTASFSAPKGNITLSLSGSDYATVGFTTGGNVSLLDNVGNTTLAASTIGGTLNVTNIAVGSTIGQTGALLVSGATTFSNGSGGILLTNSANQFGPVRFSVGAAGAQISEGTTLNLSAGSVATGPVILSSGGDFITSGVGGSSFTDALTIQANGTIIPGAGSLLVVKTFTVFSNNTKDLSKLSKSGNLTNQDPVNFGTGTYIPPSP